MDHTILILFTNILTGLLLYGFWQEYLRLRQMPYLLHPNSAPDMPPQPFVSILIPARNEAHNIERLMNGILAQTYRAYEIIVVDDGSTDATPDILARYAIQNSDRPLHIVQGLPVPAGWTGKCHACQQAATIARGDWLLFLDADTAPQPELVAALLYHALHHRFDLLTIFPYIELKSFWERTIMPPFLALLHAIYPFERINQPGHHEVFANGQCILVRRTAYDTIGGHSAVCGEIVEDVMLARAIRKAGFYTGAALGLNELRVRMYTNRHEVVEGLTKNAVAGFNIAGKRSAWGGTRQFLLALLPLCLLIAGAILLATVGNSLFAWIVLMQGLIVAGVAVNFWRILLSKVDIPWPYALIWPFGLICYGFITLHSLWKIRSGRGVVWKGRTYAGTSS